MLRIEANRLAEVGQRLVEIALPEARIAPFVERLGVLRVEQFVGIGDALVGFAFCGGGLARAAPVRFGLRSCRGGAAKGKKKPLATMQNKARFIDGAFGECLPTIWPGHGPANILPGPAPGHYRLHCSLLWGQQRISASERPAAKCRVDFSPPLGVEKYGLADRERGVDFANRRFDIGGCLGMPGADLLQHTLQNLLRLTQLSIRVRLGFMHRGLT